MTKRVERSNMYFKDPKTGEQSISLTLLIVTFLCAIGAGALNMFGKTSSTSIFAELFYSSAALYFSRRFSIGGKSFSADKAEEIVKKVE